MGNDRNLVLRGTVCFSPEPGKLEMAENAYLVCEEGICSGVFRSLPRRFEGLPLTDWGDRLILPGLVDLHIHAPQYGFRGLGMDLELLEWLNTWTFPEEAKYADPDYAEQGYRIFSDSMKRSATTRACVFATLHREATVRLMEQLEESGLKTMVGKVNMDRNSPEFLREKDPESAARDTLQWLEETAGRFSNTTPILTPRFIPTCSDELMERLGEIQRAWKLPVQSHLSENREEIAWVRQLCPWSDFYGDAYDRFGLFGGEAKTIMAHCVWSSEEEIGRMKERGVFIAHCPQSNTNLSSGIAPARRYLEEGMNLGLGTDVAGGTGESVFRAMADAVQVSKLRWRLVNEKERPLTAAEAFYLGTKGGGAFFGKVGSFEEGYEFDAVVMDDSSLRSPRPLEIEQRLERLIYLADDRHVAGKYVAGQRLF